MRLALVAWFAACAICAAIVLSGCDVDDPCRDTATMMTPGDREWRSRRHNQGEIRMIEGKAYWICECPKAGPEGESE